MSTGINKRDANFSSYDNQNSTTRFTHFAVKGLVLLSGDIFNHDKSLYHTFFYWNRDIKLRNNYILVTHYHK